MFDDTLCHIEWPELVSSGWHIIHNSAGGWKFSLLIISRPIRQALLDLVQQALLDLVQQALFDLKQYSACASIL